MNERTVRGGGPLYRQIQQFLTKKISTGGWKPGEMIPGEISLGKELSVSQGTVRKAINEMVANNLLVRQQGKGTFVAAHDPQRALFHFFHIANNEGGKILPDSQIQSCKCIKAGEKEAAALNLSPGTDIIVIQRTRYLDNQPTLAETIFLPTSHFQKLCKIKYDEIPNNLYEYYEHSYGITIHRAEEKLRATSATKRDATILGVKAKAPLLVIERIAYTLDGTPMELRISRCNTRNHFYQNTVV